MADPIYDAKVNILGTLNVLECCRKFKVAKVIYASSAAVYGHPQFLPIDEKHPVQPTSPYGISKYTPEHYLAIYSKIHGIKYVILRYANVFGPRQDPLGEGGVVAIFTDQLLRGVNPTIYGDGEQTRDFVYVKDVAQANWLALNRGDNQILNVSTGQRTSINELYQTISKFVVVSNGDSISEKLFSASYKEERSGDIRDSCLDYQRAGEYLGWKPFYNLDQGLKETIDNYSRNL
jgi:UDP-glucose 4-epimerase